MVLGELDSLICFDHPDSDPETGAVHCCGHCAQTSALLGLAAALKEPGVLDALCGKIRLCAVPAEELVEIDYRRSLKERGIINHYEGKVEFLSRGYFDGVDLAFMVHTTGGNDFKIKKGTIGSFIKTVTFKGVASHAGGSPWNGKNALYAATQGLSAINAIRETFKESDLIREHSIITKGGSVVNAIPDEVIIESQIRGRDFDAIVKANKKVDKALCGAALSLDTNVEIEDIPAFAPLENNDDMIDIAEEAAKLTLPQMPVSRIGIGTGCTDMGILSLIMPVVHPHMPGAEGKAHGADYRIANPELACVGSAKWQLNMLSLLLGNGAERAYKIIENFIPKFASKEEYFEYIGKMTSIKGNRIEYKDDGTAVVKL